MAFLLRKFLEFKVRSNILMKKIIIMIITLLMISVLSGCGEDKSQPAKESGKKVENKIDLSKLKDGIYTAESARDEKLGISQITLTVENHKIVAAEFVGYDLFGNAKGEDYGTLTGDKSSADYKKAQVAVKANSEYAKQFLDTQRLDKVDAISGATISYNQFMEAAEKALKQAENETK